MEGQALVNPRLVQYDKTREVDSSAWVRWSLYLLMGFPIVDYGLRYGELHIVGIVWDKVVLLILAVATILRLLTGTEMPKYRFYKYAGWFIVFGLGLAFAGLSHPIISAQGFRIDVYYMLYMFLIPILISRDDVMRLLHVGASVAILVAVHGIYQYIVKTPIPQGFVDVSENVRTRVFSVFTSPNELGAYMALMTPIVIGLAIQERNRWRRWMYGIGSLACLMTLLVTFTRGAWAAALISLLTMAILFERRLFIALVVLGVGAYFLPPIHHRIADLFSPSYMVKTTQSGGRIARWLTAFDKLSANPLLGVGPGHYGGAVAADYHLSIYSDNYYAKTMGETGLIGLSLYLAMHLSLIKDLYQNALQKLGRNRYLVLGGITGLLAVLVHNSFENVFEAAPMAASYFVYACLFLILGRQLLEEGAHVAQ